jgi:hypothetical protein
MSRSASFHAHHSPMGAYASFTMGMFGARGRHGAADEAHVKWEVEGSRAQACFDQFSLGNAPQMRKALTLILPRIRK